MKRLLFLFVLLIGATGARAQLQLQLSQYQINSYLYNPAIAGIEDFMDVKATYRKQYTGIPNSPSTIFLTGHKAINQKELDKEDLGALPMRGASTIRFKTDVPRKIRHGVGGTMISDNLGLLNRTMVSGGYAVHFPIAKKFYLSVGASLGLGSVGFYADGVVHNKDGGDAAYGGNRAVLPDAGLGAFLYSDKLYIGLSGSQLFMSKVNFNANTNLNKVTAHYNLTAAYRIVLDDEFDFVPSGLLKYSKQSFAGDLGVKVRYRSNFYAGVAYRVANAKIDYTSDALTGLVGLTINKTIDIGYAYDFTTSALKAGSTGSHEITLGVRLFNKKAPASKLW